MKVLTAVVELLKAEPEWRAFFKRCCKTSGYRLASQGWQFKDEMADRGQRFYLEKVEDALLALARELLPDTPGAQWDADWADKLTKEAMGRMQEQYSGLSATEKEALDLSCQYPHGEAMHVSGEDNDPVAFREALKSWERVGLEALDKVRGAACEVAGKSGVA
jgi:hypothetical protein